MLHWVKKMNIIIIIMHAYLDKTNATSCVCGVRRGVWERYSGSASAPSPLSAASAPFPLSAASVHSRWSGRGEF